MKTYEIKLVDNTYLEVNATHYEIGGDFITLSITEASEKNGDLLRTSYDVAIFRKDAVISILISNTK